MNCENGPIPPQEDRWFLLWEKGGRIVLVGSFSKAPLCPVCEAPMLLLEGGAVCYACGTTFYRKGKRLCLDFGRHPWPDSACGRFLAYDKDRGKDWYEGLDPSELQD